MRPPPESTATDYLYQPARPLNRVTLFDFKTLDDNYGENPIGAALEKVDPVMPHYAAALQKLGEQQFFQKTVEELFQEGLVKVVFATETLSLGINMPAKSVVIEDLWKFQGERHELVTPGEYTQLTGRAGRRGIDALGHAVVIYQKQVPF